MVVVAVVVVVVVVMGGEGGGEGECLMGGAAQFEEVGALRQILHQ